MGIAEVRGALETVLRSVDGIKSASGYPTESVGSEPFAYVGFDDDVIVSGPRELDIHALPVYVFVSRSGGNLPNQVRSTEAVITAVRNALRLNHTLSGTVDRVQTMRVREGVYGHAGHDYVGFVMDLEIKESRGVSYG